MKERVDVVVPSVIAARGFSPDGLRFDVSGRSEASIRRSGGNGAADGVPAGGAEPA